MNPETSNDNDVTPTRNLSFTILNNETPVENADVYLIGGNITKQATTGSAGGCTIRDVPDGEYRCAVELDSENGFEATITVSESNTTFTLDSKDYDPL